MLRILLILIFLISSIVCGAQQVCSGTLGDAITEAGTDFGRGISSFGTPTPANTTYEYVAGSPQDGFYTLVKTTAGLNSAWHQNITNHTPNDPNGYMMVVNADYSQGIFYKTTVQDLCPNTTYEFASYIINILNRYGIKPNIKFTIENDGLEIPGGFSTGEIPESATPQWIKYGTTFTTPANMGILTLTLSNINPGGYGNDLALDDITFRPCGPILSPFLTINNSSTASICEGESTLFNISSPQPLGYTEAAFQWQIKNGAEWFDIQGATEKDYAVQFTNAAIGSYQYRLAAAEKINIGSLKCRVVSAPINFLVKPKPIASANNTGLYCVGDQIELKASGGDSYQWVGPNFTSNLQNPVITNATTSMSGTYTVTVKLNGCTSDANTTLQILNPVVGATNVTSVDICENSGIELKAFGGNQYTWTPSTGLSATSGDETYASPKDTTIYQVKISNGVCYETKEIAVNVIKNAFANAGTDQKILAGTALNLNGKIAGGGVIYFWTPGDFLDDPTKLNPIASPTHDITYTLNVISDKCVSNSDDVFIKVYPKIEIPNSFSPNDDGINDTWNIPAALAFPDPQLKIMNRYGELIYKSTGNFKPWDGKLNGKDLPIGTYYYSIYFNEDFKTYTGWVLLTR